jgi:CRISPR-associated protein Cas1
MQRVRSGDPENIEAQAAKRYWVLLFGEGFRRDRYAEGPNSFLNYGYTVLRAATARAVLSAGLHPTLGLHHSNMQNAMRLVDDLMEPFRPLVDYGVWVLKQANELVVNSITKQYMVQLLYQDLRTEAGITPVLLCLQHLATSLAQVYMGEKGTLDLPETVVPTDLPPFSKQSG